MENADSQALGPAGARKACAFLSWAREDRATPLLALPALSASLGLGSLHVKDEAHRLGLGSFKALGGRYAVIQLAAEEAARQLGRNLTLDDIDSPGVRAITAEMTFACATAGNHGRSVASGAKRIGAKSVIFVYDGVSDDKIGAIARHGAQVIRTRGSYDDAVLEAVHLCKKNEWTLVSDTSRPGDETTPLLIMQGYTCVIAEALNGLAAAPTHIFVQAGVGGLAATVAAHAALTLEPARPTIVVVEPQRAACLYASAAAGESTKIARGEPTVMAMLECYEPSWVAWRILARTADGFLTIEERAAVDAVHRLTHPLGDDPALFTSESGCVGLAGLINACADPANRRSLGLDSQARVLVINTEGTAGLKNA